jgi:hypothetical protein
MNCDDLFRVREVVTYPRVIIAFLLFRDQKPCIRFLKRKQTPGWRDVKIAPDGDWRMEILNLFPTTHR